MLQLRLRKLTNFQKRIKNDIYIIYLWKFVLAQQMRIYANVFYLNYLILK